MRESKLAAPLALALALSSSGYAWAALSESSPNIILVLTDDQGWNGTSVPMDSGNPESKSDFYQTPNLEVLARDGMRFNNAYSAAPVCSPSRAAILTGLSPAQLQLTDIVTSNVSGRNHDGLPLTPPLPTVLSPDRVTLPRRVKQANSNYVTAHFGKWHLTPQPEAMGYDVSGRIPVMPDWDPKRIFGMTTLANRFMENRVRDGDPFFMQVSHLAVHSPIQARPETIAKYESLPPGQRHQNVEYAAMTENLDTGLGMILDKVRQLGIENNTYIIFTSDNGARRSESTSAPLTGGKVELWEGGIRVPLVVKGPGIEAGSVSDIPVTSFDLYSTVSKLVGNTEPLPDDVEGASLVPVLANGGKLGAGIQNLSRPNAENGELYFHYPHNFGVGQLFRFRPVSAVRDGDFKLVRIYGENGQPDQHALFNLADSITESKNPASSLNLARRKPEKTAELAEKLDNWLQATDASLAYDVSANVQLLWDAANPGANENSWRSVTDVDYKAREAWTPNEGSERPERTAIHPHQPGLPNHAFQFDGDDGMTHKFFHVSDATPRRNTVDPGQADFDRSVSLEFWASFDALDHEQLLFESGDDDGGLSLTVGDGDGDGTFDEIRFRALGENGKDITVTSTFQPSVNPTRDFVHVVAVLSDKENDRYAKVYVDGMLSKKVDGLPGLEESIHWDRFDDAGLGRVAGDGFGARGGTGDLPFTGGNFDGQLAHFRFYNYPIDADTVRFNYNGMLNEADFGVASTSQGAQSVSQRPEGVREGDQEADATILVIQERNDTLDDLLNVDLLPTGGQTYSGDSISQPFLGALEGGTELTSYLLHFDPIGDPDSLQTAVGTITFVEPIQGILFEEDSLVATDRLLGTIGQYATTGRDFEFNGSDFLSLSEDHRTLTLSLSAMEDELVQLRVLTRLHSVPEPEPATGDIDNDGDIDLSDFSVLAGNFTGTLEPFTGGKTRAEGDFDGDGDADFSDFSTFAFNFTGTITAPASDLPENGDVHLEIDLNDGAMTLIPNSASLAGYSIRSPDSQLVPDADGAAAPFMFYLLNAAQEVTAGSVGATTMLSENLALDISFAGDVDQAANVVFQYTRAGDVTPVDGVVHVIPEPATMILLTTGGLMLIPRRRFQMARG